VRRAFAENEVIAMIRFRRWSCGWR
jgi:hypothetical protein